MHLMRWFRKNNKQLMAIVVVVLMVGFVGGTALTRSCSNLGQSRKQVIATYGQNQKIRLSDMDQAQLELTILQELKASELLLQLSRVQDIGLLSVAMGEVLFPEKEGSAVTIAMLKQARAQQGLNLTITDKQIYDLFKVSEPPYIYWIMLTQEAQENGIIIAKDQVKLFLNDIIPRLFNGATYQQVINAMVNVPVDAERMPVTENQILTAFGKLIGILEYSRFVCSSEDVTEEQIMASIKSELQTMDVNYVKFNPEVFIKEATEPTAEKQNEQYEKYKNYFTGDVSQDNPHGFGYKIPNCAQLQYMLIKVSDVEKIVPKPTQEEMENFYTQNKSAFTSLVLSDPNDPNSSKKEQLKPFAEVAGLIEKYLTGQKVEMKANQIIQRAMTLTENPEAEAKPITAEEFLKIENNYQKTAEVLKKEFNMPIIFGQTGYLSAIDFQEDKVLESLILKGPRFDPVRNPTYESLYRIVFAVPQLGTSEIDPINFSKSQMYKNIGPLDNISGTIKAIFRIINVRKAAPPESITQSFNKEPVVTEPNSVVIKIYQVKDAVIKDLKKLEVENLTKKQAEDFIQQVGTSGDWKQAVEELNKKYPKGKDKKETEPNNFVLVNLLRQKQIPEYQIYALKLGKAGDPVLDADILAVNKQRLFLQQLDSLAASEPNGIKKPLVWGFAPDMSFYCIKDLSVNPVYQNDFDMRKIQQAYFEDILRTQSLALVFFDPENILKRNGYIRVEEKKVSGPNDVNRPGI